ncbi:hypothetical protein [Microbacterium sp. MYb62]|uniref:hypothetical protein n=1 Tax=Microbacterium sp. MYb62 TaxID=1848690 RepID=UPI000CFDFF11|nr:hypothetical protein [Microbacterium sp. MYb62]PRB11545.1 hypothetical protein CQ042_16555 [Microbacterium sp. MYb62]
MTTDIAPKNADEKERDTGHPIVNIDPDLSMPTGAERDTGHPIVNIDPDLSMPTGADRSGSYLRAMRILFPKAP